MSLEDRLRSIIAGDARRRHALEAVEEFSLADGWIGAGFVRDAVWDHLHGRPASPPHGDVDVIWFDAGHMSEERDREIEAALRRVQPDLDWSVKNQARMHLRNGDAPYRSVADAMCAWPETATAVAVRQSGDALEINAPFGLDDLFAPRLAPTAAFVERKRAIFDARVAAKRWLERYPLLER